MADSTATSIQSPRRSSFPQPAKGISRFMSSIDLIESHTIARSSLLKAGSWAAATCPLPPAPRQVGLASTPSRVPEAGHLRADLLPSLQLSPKHKQFADSSMSLFHLRTCI